MRTTRIAAMTAVIATLPLGGCSTADQGMPLIFGRTQTVGISVAGTVPDQGAHVTIGFSDRNVAIVPTTAPGDDRIRSMAGDGFEDALSVLGQFEASADGTKVGAGLGTFFSTGLAARSLADGFRCEMGDCDDGKGDEDPADGTPVKPD